jgi:hypothetical protein
MDNDVTCHTFFYKGKKKIYPHAVLSHVMVYPNSDHSPFLTVYHGKSRGNKTNGNFFLSFVLVDKEKDIQREEVSRLIEFWVLSKIFSNTRTVIYYVFGGF